MGSGFGIRSRFGFRVWVSGSELRVIGWVVIGVEVEEVEGEEDAVNEQLIGGDKLGLRQRRVSELPELESGEFAVSVLILLRLVDGVSVCGICEVGFSIFFRERERAREGGLG